MLTNISKLEVKVDGKSFSLLCDCDSPLISVKEALFQFTKYVAHIQDSAKAAEESKASEELESKPSESEELVEAPLE